MPSIEIACVELGTPAPIEARGFTVTAERGLKSRCVPSRFQNEFDQVTGCLYHLGRPRDPRQGSAFLAYDLLSAESRERFPASLLTFASEHVAEIERVLETIVAASPSGQALFTSDWQFGPEWAYRFGPLKLQEFWRLHESRALYFNTAYALVA